MFREILRFELQYRRRRAAFYVYFFTMLLLTAWGFAEANIGLHDKEYVNAPAALANFQAALSVFLTLVSATLMGTPLYRDLENDTKEYYLSYPITRAGYFWGRYLGSFLFVALVGAALPIGEMLGSRLGPILGWTTADRYEASSQWFYWQPYFTQVLPNLFFTSSLFFGLVAVTRNVKVIYSGSLFLFLGYILSNFFLNNIHNATVIYLADPFNVNGLRAETSGLSPAMLNKQTIPLKGLLLENRILWLAVGAAALLITWLRFDFERFFSGRRTRTPAGTPPAYAPESAVSPTPHIHLQGTYYRKTLFSLTRIELLNLVRDGYLWIILSGGLFFLIFIFWHVPLQWGITDYPRTAFFMDAFAGHLVFFLFVMIVFFAGETVHRERLTRYSFINDTLPPPTWVFNCAKLLSLIFFAIFLSVLPVILGLAIQGLKGYPYVDLPMYASAEFVSILPKMVGMVLFTYAIHIAVNNKFAAHGIAIGIWTLLFIAYTFGYFDYNLFLYSYGPPYWPSDMDGIGHLVRPLLWFQSYWTLAGALMVVVASLFYARGTRTSIREKVVLARQRFHGPTRAGFGVLLAGLLAVGGFIYYNVSCENEYLTTWEHQERAAQTEKKLKRYDALPLPVVTAMRLHIDLYPDQQQQSARAEVMVVNKGHGPIDSLLMDGDRLDYSLRYQGKAMPYTCPLYFEPGRFSLFRTRQEPSDYRVYTLPSPLRPGDSAEFEITSSIGFHGFQNGFYGGNMLHNGTITTGDLPGLGYDEGDELNRNDIRKEHGLPEKVPHDIPQDDTVGLRTRNDDIAAGLIPMDITVSTSADQWAVAPGRLDSEWITGGRHYFHYVQARPGVYPPFAIASARYSQLKDTVQLAPGHTVAVTIFYHRTDNLNLSHFMAALKDGLHFYSRAYGLYPFDHLYLVETPNYGPYDMSFPGMLCLAEARTGWNGGLKGSKKMDYAYYNTVRLLAQQWWGQQVAANNTVGSPILADGLSRYSALQLMHDRFGDAIMPDLLGELQRDYGWGYQTNYDGENDLLHANRGYLSDSKAGLVLYGLGRRMGDARVDSALRDLVSEWAFRKEGPYPGAPDLYKALLRHTPDSLHTWLRTAWEKPGPPPF